jgi:hypothetical protein
MNEAHKFALVLRPPGALEKADPGAKHILSAMIADTVALIPDGVNAEIHQRATGVERCGEHLVRRGG